MIYYKFKLNYRDGKTEIRCKMCKRYKSTKLYKQCIEMLENDLLTSFAVSNE